MISSSRELVSIRRKVLWVEGNALITSVSIVSPSFVLPFMTVRNKFLNSVIIMLSTMLDEMPSLKRSAGRQKLGAVHCSREMIRALISTKFSHHLGAYAKLVP